MRYSEEHRTSLARHPEDIHTGHGACWQTAEWVPRAKEHAGHGKTLSTVTQLAHSDMHTPYTCFPISSTQTHLIQLIPLQDYCWVNTFSVVGDESILEFQSKIVESLQNEHR